jgi:hypothetical protein
MLLGCRYNQRPNVRCMLWLTIRAGLTHTATVTAIQYYISIIPNCAILGAGGRV